MKAIVNAPVLETLHTAWVQIIQERGISNESTPMCIISTFKDVTKVLATKDLVSLRNQSGVPKIILTWDNESKARD